MQKAIATRIGELAVFDEGGGTPVVFWPSLFSDHHIFDSVVEGLGEGWRTVRIDGPGFGKSDPLGAGEKPEMYAEAMFEVLDALEIKRAILVGCSWGGQVVLHAGVRAPERAIGLLAMNTPLAPSIGGHFMELYGTKFFGSTEFWGRGVARSMVAPDFMKSSPEKVARFVQRFREFDKKAASSTVRRVMTQFPGMADILPRIEVPTVLQMGAEDRLYPVQKMQKIAALSNIARVQVIPKCGHLAPLEAPLAVCLAIRQLSPGPLNGSQIELQND